MQCDQSVLWRLVNLELGRLRAMFQQRVDHHVAYEMNLSRIDAFTFEVFVGIATCREEKVG